jgi:hypothetical protein
MKRQAVALIMMAASLVSPANSRDLVRHDDRAALDAQTHWSVAGAQGSELAGSAGGPFGGAPIGHLQPRAQRYASGSVADQTERRRLATFDAAQQRLNRTLDKKLSICRC